MSLLATPFHARAVEANRLNVWETRGAYTLASHYGSAAEEAVAARFGSVLADLSWYWRAVFSGGDIDAFVAKAFTRNGAVLEPGHGLDVLWLNDGGAVRGRGVLVRLDASRFLLLSSQEDRDWLFFAASLYGVTCHDQSTDGILALIGVTARKILAAAGIGVDLPPLGFQRLAWRGLDIAISRLGLGYELWCDADGALIAWDRLMAAGRIFALRPAGQSAFDTLEFEGGVLQPGRDFSPAQDGFSSAPSTQSLGLSALVDRGHAFNGKRGYLADGPDTELSGVLLGSEVPAVPQTLTLQGRPVGTLLNVRYSPVFHGVLGFAVVDKACPSGELTAGPLSCRSVALPFLPIPAIPEATEAAGNRV